MAILSSFDLFAILERSVGLSSELFLGIFDAEEAARLGSAP